MTHIIPVEQAAAKLSALIHSLGVDEENGGLAYIADIASNLTMATLTGLQGGFA